MDPRSLRISTLYLVRSASKEDTVGFSEVSTAGFSVSDIVFARQKSVVVKFKFEGLQTRHVCPSRSLGSIFPYQDNSHLDKSIPNLSFRSADVFSSSLVSGIQTYKYKYVVTVIRPVNPNIHPIHTT